MVTGDSPSPTHDGDPVAEPGNRATPVRTPNMKLMIARGIVLVVLSVLALPFVRLRGDAGER